MSTEEAARALFEAARKGDDGEVSKLVSKYPKAVNFENPESGVSPIHGVQSAAAVESLVAAGADVSALDGTGMTALHTAGNGETAKALLAAGVDINAVSERYGTALHRNARDDEDSLEILEILLEHSPDLALGLGKNRRTALHLAAERKAVNAVKLLLDASADVDARDSVGATPLHLAVLAKSAETAELLLEYGADPDAELVAGTVLKITESRTWKGDTKRQAFSRKIKTPKDLINDNAVRKVFKDRGAL